MSEHDDILELARDLRRAGDIEVDMSPGDPMGFSSTMTPQGRKWIIAGLRLLAKSKKGVSNATR